MNFLNRLSIKGKMTAIAMFTSCIALVATCLVMLVYEVISFRQAAIQHSTTLARIINSYCLGYIDFSDRATESQIMSAFMERLKADKGIISACVYDNQGIRAMFPTNAPISEFKEVSLGDNVASRLNRSGLHVFVHMQHPNGGVISTYIHSDVHEIFTRLYQYLGVSAIVLVAAAFLGFLVSTRLQRVISQPILSLSDTASSVSGNKDYAVRAQKFGVDELGRLTDSFNEMLSQIQKRDTELQEARVIAEKASQAKTDFLSSMSHEIRTPMNAILGYAQILQRANDIPPKHRRAIETIETSGEHLLSLINNILDLSKIEKGRMELNKTDFDLEVLVENLSSMFRLRCEQKGLGWKAEFESKDEAVLVHGDEMKLRQVLINLCGNAVKFTDKGEVVLRIKSCELKGANQGATPTPTNPERTIFEFEVIDTGYGVPRAIYEKIFLPFEQASGADQKGGHGLGLAIAKGHIELMGGKIGMESEPGKGSRFYFSLPLKVLEKRGRKEAKTHFDRKHATRLKAGCLVKALVVDDVPANREVLSQILEDIGCELLTANNGQSGIEKALGARPDIIFMDIRMPGVDGVEAVKHIRSELQNSKSGMKIVSISATALAHEQEHYRQAGFDDFIAKPFRIEGICDCLVRLLHVEFEAQPPSTPAVAGSPTLSSEELASIRLPHELWQSLYDASERFSATRLEEGFKRLEQLEQVGQKLANHLRTLSAGGDFDAIANALKLVNHAR